MNALLTNALAVATPDMAAVTDIRIRNGRIAELGTGLLAGHDEHCVDLDQCVVYPGLVNTHHHLAQSMLKGVPAGLNQPLGDWLASVPYRYWPEFTPDLMYDAARLGFLELLRSGTTTCADHHYLYHRDTPVELEDALWQAADEMGIRLVLCRGGATHTGSHKGLAGRDLQPETLDQMLAGLDRTRQRYHQSGGDAMRSLVVAPTSLMHTSPKEHLQVLAAYARNHQLKLHSHLLEVAFDEQQAQAQHGCSAVDYADQCDWLGPDVWFAHLVRADASAIAKLAQSQTGIAHCPTSNCRLGSGVAPVLAMEEAGMTVSLGVDGSASSESGSMLQELNLAWLLHRALHGAEATRPEQILNWATRQGAALLGLTDTGDIRVGQSADLVAFDLSAPRYSGLHSSLWAPIIAGEPARVKYSWVQGRKRVEDGQVRGLDEQELANRVRRGVQALIRS